MRNQPTTPIWPAGVLGMLREQEIGLDCGGEAALESSQVQQTVGSDGRVASAAGVDSSIDPAQAVPAGWLLALGSGKPIQHDLRARMEGMLQADLSSVRIHQGELALAMGARAFTMGDLICFAPGMYEPSTRRGLALLGHELTHVLQQRAGRVNTPSGCGPAIVADPLLEAEADEMGRLAADASRSTTSAMGQLTTARRRESATSTRSSADGQLVIQRKLWTGSEHVDLLPRVHVGSKYELKYVPHMSDNVYIKATDLSSYPYHFGVAASAPPMDDVLPERRLGPRMIGKPVPALMKAGPATVAAREIQTAYSDERGAIPGTMGRYCFTRKAGSIRLCKGGRELGFIQFSVESLNKNVKVGKVQRIEVHVNHEAKGIRGLGTLMAYYYACHLKAEGANAGQLGTSDTSGTDERVSPHWTTNHMTGPVSVMLIKNSRLLGNKEDAKKLRTESLLASRPDAQVKVLDKYLTQPMTWVLPP